MKKDEHLERHLELCRQVYLRMLADGSWPWADKADSPKSKNVIESEDNTDNI